MIIYKTCVINVKYVNIINVPNSYCKIIILIINYDVQTNKCRITKLWTPNSVPEADHVVRNNPKRKLACASHAWRNQRFLVNRVIEKDPIYRKCIYGNQGYGKNVFVNIINKGFFFLISII